LAAAAYKDGAAAQKVGAIVATAGYAVQIGDVTPAAPATITVGGAAIILGGVTAATGTAMQAAAGLYYLAHGNAAPFSSTVVGYLADKSLDLLKDAGVNPGVTNTASQAADMSREANSKETAGDCKPN